MESRITRYAAAAVFVLAILWVAGHLTGSPGPQVPMAGNTPKTEAPVVPDGNKDRLQIEAALAAGLKAKGDVQGLIGLLETGLDQTKVLVAGYLGQIGNERALPALRRLADQWKVPAEENPFTMAIEAIQGRSAPEPNPAPEVNTVGRVPEANQARVEPNWPEVTCVYCSTRTVMADGNETRDEYWLRLPDHLREEGVRVVTVDDGVRRLVLWPQTRQAQYSDSMMQAVPLSGNGIWDLVLLFRGRRTDEFRCSKAQDQDEGKYVLYDVYSAQHPDLAAKAWVDPQTMLPLRYEACNSADPNLTDGEVEGEAIFDYSSIPDSVFSTEVPDGYPQPPHCEFSGFVVDEKGRPVPGAEVVLSSLGIGPWQSRAGPKGQFRFNRPIRHADCPPHGPLLVFAVSPDAPDRVAWAILHTEEEKAKLSKFISETPLPGPWQSMMVSQGDSKAVSATDILLTMESAGHIVGVIRDPAGMPIAGATVEVTFRLQVEATAVAYCDLGPLGRSDAQGLYQIAVPRLWEGCSFSLRAKASGHVTSQFDLTVKDPIAVTTVDMTLPWVGPTVRGVLVDNYGTPLPKRQVRAMVDGKEYYDCSVTTDTNGGFEIPNCPADPRLCIKADLSAQPTPSRPNDTFYPDVIVPVNLVSDQSDYEIRMVATRPDLTIAVEVVDTNGLPIAYFPVQIRADLDLLPPHWVMNQGSRWTDPNGRCTFEAVPAVHGLRVWCWADNPHMLDTGLSEQAKVEAKRVRQAYGYSSPHRLSVVPGQKHYSVRVEVLTKEEYQKRTQDGR